MSKIIQCDVCHSQIQHGGKIRIAVDAHLAHKRYLEVACYEFNANDKAELIDVCLPCLKKLLLSSEPKIQHGSTPANQPGL